MLEQIDYYKNIIQNCAVAVFIIDNTHRVEEFASTLEKELDYTLEASYMERFSRQFEDEPAVYVPHVYREATTSRVLTMELISGVKASDIELLEKEGLDRCKIAKQGFNLIMKQIFVHGFFHADPHPGNIFINPFKGNPRGSS